MHVFLQAIKLINTPYINKEANRYDDQMIKRQILYSSIIKSPQTFATKLRKSAHNASFHVDWQNDAQGVFSEGLAADASIKTHTGK